MFYSLLVKSRWDGAHLMAGLLLLALTAAGPLASTFACADVHARFLALGHVHLGVGLGDLEEDGAGRDFTLLDQDGLDQDWGSGLVVQDDWGLSHDHRWVVDEDAGWGRTHVDRGLSVQVDLLVLLAAAGLDALGLGHFQAVVLVGGTGRAVGFLVALFGGRGGAPGLLGAPLRGAFAAAAAVLLGRVTGRLLESASLLGALDHHQVVVVQTVGSLLIAVSLAAA